MEVPEVHQGETHMPQIQVLTARGTRLTATRSDGSIVFLYRGRPLSNLPIQAILERKTKGLHLSKDEDPKFWVCPESLALILAVLGTT